MFNKVCLFSLLLSCGAFVCAADMTSYSINMESEAAFKASSSIDAKFENEKKFPSEGASEDGVVTLKFEIDKTTTGIDDAGHAGEIVHFFDTTRKCSMIKIDDNWLIGSSYCFNFLPYEKYTSWTFDGETVKQIKDVRIGGEKITHIFDGSADTYANVKEGRADLPLYIGSDVMLLFIGDNANLKKKYNKLPKANIYIPAKPELSAALLKDLKFYISRRSAFWGIREKQEREVKELGDFCNGSRCIKIKFGLMHAEAMAGDPLFAIGPNSMEFIIGFNTGDEDKEDSQSRSRYFKELSDKSYKAMEKAISSKDAEGWKRIKSKVAGTYNVFVRK